MRILLFVIVGLFLTSPSSLAQKKVAVIKYKTFVNGTENIEVGITTIEYFNEIAKINKVVSLSNDETKLLPAPISSSYIDFTNSVYLQMVKLQNGDEYCTETPFSELPEVSVADTDEDILGYKCKHLTATVFSNRIDIYYTNDIDVKGTPIPRYGLANGLVLKVVRNGNYALIANEIEFISKKKLTVEIPQNTGNKVDKFSYDHLIKQSYVREIEIFKEEQISWGNEIDNPMENEMNKTFKYAGGTIILKKVYLPEDINDYSIFAEAIQYSNGDAYDRTATVFTIPMEKQLSFLDALNQGVAEMPLYTDNNELEYRGVISDNTFDPPIEIMRFFTPFGINHFNERRLVPGLKWENSVLYKQDVTELSASLRGEVWIGAFIGNYDKGGHTFSLKLKYYPESFEVNENKESDQWVYSIFNTLNIMEMAGQSYATMFKNDSLEMEIIIPENVENIYLRYISTGHGGWGGGDEFNQKLNEIFIDDQLVFNYIPWRTDCGTYRDYNPASGNFQNGMSSSDYNRSGWCPGTITNPVYIPLKNLKPGKHTLKVAIPMGKKEGSSFSSWNISGVLIGDYKK